MTREILEAQELKKDDEEEEEGPNILDDLREAYTLLGQCKVMLAYLADPVLCKAISERERQAMRRLGSHVTTYRTSVKDFYSAHGADNLF